METVINIFKGIKRILSPRVKKIKQPVVIDARKILWSIVPQFIYNIKDNRIITNFDDPLWLDKKNNIINSVNVYNVECESVKCDLIKKINRSSFTIVYEFGEKEWKFLCVEDFKNRPRHSFLNILHSIIHKNEEITNNK